MIEFDATVATADAVRLLMDNAHRIDSYETFLGASVCAAADVVVARARAAGVARPNVPAILQAVTERLLLSWQQDRPHWFAAYLAEIGPEPTGR